MINIIFTPFPNFTTERLTLRQLTSEDEVELFKLRSDERVMRFLARPRFKTIEQARELITKLNDGISRDEWIFWAITLKNDKNLIGTICIWNISKENFRAEVGFELHPDFQGKGIMQEALTKILDYGFNTMKLHSMEGYVNPNNLPSIKLMEKNNFVREAYFKENIFYDGKFLDSGIYSLINPNDKK